MAVEYRNDKMKMGIYSLHQWVSITLFDETICFRTTVLQQQL